MNELLEEIVHELDDFKLSSKDEQKTKLINCLQMCLDSINLLNDQIESFNQLETGKDPILTLINGGKKNDE